MFSRIKQKKFSPKAKVGLIVGIYVVVAFVIIGFILFIIN